MEYHSRIMISEEDDKALALAATGSPYLIIVRNKKDTGYIVSATDGFNIATLFSFLDNFIRENKDDKKMQSCLADGIIELSKALRDEED